MALPVRRNSRGFTLVELLIVVAIIGVLSTIGVPTFRKMVTKAKKSEAKVSLGGLFTVESAFFTEYSTYGNHLDKVGFEIEGRQKLYSTGFPAADCASQAVQPSVDPQKASLTTLVGDYYTTTAVTVRNRGISSTTGTGTGTTSIGKCYAANVANDGTTFTASATGNIAPGVLSTDLAEVPSVAGTKVQDVWTMDNSRNLVNLVDGTN